MRTRWSGSSLMQSLVSHLPENPTCKLYFVWYSGFWFHQDSPIYYENPISILSHLLGPHCSCMFHIIESLEANRLLVLYSTEDYIFCDCMRHWITGWCWRIDERIMSAIYRCSLANETVSYRLEWHYVRRERELTDYLWSEEKGCSKYLDPGKLYIAINF